MAKRRPFDPEVEDQPQEENVAPRVEAAPQAGNPITLAQAFENLRTIENSPNGPGKAERLAAAKKVCADLQQGLPVLSIGADGYAKAHTSKVEDLRMARLRILARTNLDVDWLLKQYELQ